MCSTSSFLLRQRSENRWVQPGLLPQHGQPDGCILLVLWARASFRGAQPPRNKICLLELGLGSPAVPQLFNWGKKGRGPYGFRATCPILFDFSSRFFGKGHHFCCLLGPWLCHQKPSTVPMPSTSSSRRKFLCFTSHGLPSLICCCATQPLRHSSKGTTTIGLLSSKPSCPAFVDESSDRNHGQCPAFTRTCSWGVRPGAPLSPSPAWPYNIPFCCRPTQLWSKDSTAVCFLQQQHSCSQEVAWLLVQVFPGWVAGSYFADAAG